MNVLLCNWLHGQLAFTCIWEFANVDAVLPVLLCPILLYRGMHVQSMWNNAVVAPGCRLRRLPL